MYHGLYNICWLFVNTESGKGSLQSGQLRQSPKWNYTYVSVTLGSGQERQCTVENRLKTLVLKERHLSDMDLT